MNIDWLIIVGEFALFFLILGWYLKYQREFKE